MDKIWKASCRPAPLGSGKNNLLEYGSNIYPVLSIRNRKFSLTHQEMMQSTAVEQRKGVSPLLAI